MIYQVIQVKFATSEGEKSPLPVVLKEGEGIAELNRVVSAYLRSEGEDEVYAPDNLRDAWSGNELPSEVVVFEPFDSYEISTSLCCPYTRKPLTEAVVATDGCTYNESTVQKLCGPRLTVNSLQTRRAVRKDRFTVNQTARDLLKAHWYNMRMDRLTAHASRNAMQRRKWPVSCLRTFDQKMHELRRWLARFPNLHIATDDGVTLKIMVVGSESTGKSTVLELLASMGWFPSDIDTTTKMVVILRIRPSDELCLPTMELVPLVRESEGGPYREGAATSRLEIPASEAGKQIVLEKMNELLQARPEKCIIRDLQLVLTFRGVDFPKLDLIDVPGAVEQPEEQRVATVACIEDVARAHPDAIILMTHNAAVDIQASSILNILDQNNFFPRSMCVLTHADKLHKKSPSDFRELANLVMGRTNIEGCQVILDSMPGRFAMVMAEPLPDDHPYNEHEVLDVRRRKEVEFFNEVAGGQELLGSGKVTINAVERGITEMSKVVLRDHGLRKRTEIAVTRGQLAEMEIALGYPQAHLHLLEEERRRLASSLASQCRVWLEPQCSAGRQAFRSRFLTDFQKALREACAEFAAAHGLVSLDSLALTQRRGVAALEVALKRYLGNVLADSPWRVFVSMIVGDVSSREKMSRFPQLAPRLTTSLETAFREMVSSIEKHLTAFLMSIRNFPQTPDSWRFEGLSAFDVTMDIPADTALVSWNKQFSEELLAVVAVSLSSSFSCELSEAMLRIVEEELGEDSMESCRVERLSMLEGLRLMQEALDELSIFQE